MDYDGTSMPESYDSGRGYPPAVLAAWLEHIARRAPRETSDVLDLGCGTGRYSGPLAAQLRANVLAVEPSQKMLGQAARKDAPNVFYVRGKAESLPLTDTSFDLVFMSMVFHHLDDPAAAVRECRRVLRPGGVVCLRAATQEQIESYPYVPFFPTSREILAQTLQSSAFIKSQFDAAGFELGAHELIVSEVGSNWSEYADKLSCRADSILIQLPNEEFMQGLAVMRGRGAAARTEEPIAEPVDFFSFRVVP